MTPLIIEPSSYDVVLPHFTIYRVGPTLSIDTKALLISGVTEIVRSTGAAVADVVVMVVVVVVGVTGTGGNGKVVVAIGAELLEALNIKSNASMVYVYVVLGVSPMSLNDVWVVVAITTASRYTR